MGGSLTVPGAEHQPLQRLLAVVEHLQPEAARLRHIGSERLEALVGAGVGGAFLQVAQDAVNPAVSRALATLPVHDLTVENAPLEEVMSELFAQSRAARGEVEDAA